MPAVVVVGAQWGDEGKGKVVDLLAPYSDVVVRYAGGANAGHTLVVGGEKIVLHLVPSGILHAGKDCIVGQGTVVDPETILGEIEQLTSRDVSVDGRLIISERAHVVMPHHKLVDGLREAKHAKIGTTKRGIGPCYEDKIGRRGIRIGDLLRDDLKDKIASCHERWKPSVSALSGELPNVDEVAAQYRELGQKLKPFVGDGSRKVADALQAGRKVLLEGAQGTMLDVDHGTYPFVTSSNAIAGGACAGAGIGPTAVGAVIGISKAYATRVGGGPFPTELEGEVGEQLRKAGAEFGATTGRPRRCGWLDAPALRMAARVNGMTSLAMTKLDVLTGMPELKICVGYRYQGTAHDEPPFDAFDAVEPIYETLPGWTEDITGCREANQLPANARGYLDRIEALIGCPIGIISVGADRNETINLRDPFSH